MRGPHLPRGLFVFMAETDLTQQIAADAAKPSSVSVDGNTVTRHSLSDQVAAQKMLGANDAMAYIAAGGWFTRVRMIPPGARGDDVDDDC